MSESNRRHAVALGLSKVPQQPRDSSPGDLPGAAVPGAGRAAPTPRLSMQVSLLVGHSQPGPSQPLSHTQAPLEQRPRSGGDSRDYLGSSAVPFPQPCLWLPHFLWGAQGLQRRFFLGCKQTPQHPPCLSASAESLPPITGHSTPRASATSPGHPVCATRPSTSPGWGLWGALTVAEEAGGARARQDVELAEGAVEAQALVLGVALALPAQALAPPRARLRVPRADAGFVVGGRGRGALARVPSPGDRDGAERGRSRAQHSAVLGRVPGASACAAVGPRTQQDPWERGVRIRTQPLPARVANALSADKVPMETALGRVQLLLLEERREEALLNGPGCPQGHFRNQKGRSRGKVLP